MAAAECARTAAPEVRPVSAVTSREITQRTGGTVRLNRQGGASFIEGPLEYCYVHISRGMNTDGKLVPSLVSLNLPGAEGEIKTPLKNTGVVLGQDYVTFVSAPRPVRVGKEVKEVVTVATISKKGVSVSAIVFRPGSLDPNLEKAAKLAQGALESRAQVV